MVTQALYNDRMQGLFGFSGSNSADNPIRNIRKSTDSLMNIEQDQLDSSHDMQDLLEEQIKLLKRIAKATEKYGNVANNNRSGASGLVGGALDAYLLGKGLRGKGAAALTAAEEGIAAKSMVKRATGAVVNWTRSVTGHIGTAFTRSTSFLGKVSSSMYDVAKKHITSFSGAMLGHIGGFLKGTTSLLGTGVKFAGKLLTRLATPAFAAYGAYDGYQTSKQMDPNGNTGLMGRANAAVAGGVDSAAWGIPSMLSQLFTGKNFAEMAAGTDIAKQKAIDDARAKGQKSLGDYVSGLLGSIGTLITPSASSKAQASIAQSISTGQAKQAISAANSNVIPVPADATGPQPDFYIDTTKPTEAPKSTVTLGQVALRGNQIAADVGRRAHMDAVAIFSAVKGSLPSTAGATSGTNDNATPTVTGFAPDAAMYAAAASHGSSSGTADTVFNPPAAAQHPSITQSTSIADGAVGYGNSAAVTNKNGRVISTADTSMKPNQRAFLDTIAGGEAKSYTEIAGGKSFSDFSKHPNIVGLRTKYGPSTAAGRYQFTNSTWNSTVAQYNKANPDNPITDFSPKSQDRAALFLAGKDYARRTGGRSLQADLDSGMPIGALMKQGLGGVGSDTTWQSLQNPSAGKLDSEYQANLARNNGYTTNGSNATNVGSGIVGTGLPGDNKSGVNAIVQQTQGDVAGIRKGQITDSLAKQVAQGVLETFGPGYTAKVYSGGQPSAAEGGPRTGSTRHDDGHAADFRIYGPDGKQITQEQYTKFGQNYLSQKLGGIGLQMSGGGIHADEHPERAPMWTYDDKGGIPVTGDNLKALKAGVAGITPDGLAMSSQQAAAYLNGTAVNKVKLQSITNSALFTPSTLPGAFSTNTAPTPDELKQTGLSIGQGIVQAQQNTPNIPAFDPSGINGPVINAVDSAPTTPAQAANRKDDTIAPSGGPLIDSIPHTDDLTMMMANSQMMA